MYHYLFPGRINNEDLLTKTNFVIDPNNKINSFAVLNSVDSINTGTGNEAEGNVWKVFSQLPLSDDELDDIFAEKKQVVTCEWLAYPHYATNQTSTFTNFKLEENLYHINAIEWAASAMEMSVLGAKNVANMIVKTLQDQKFQQNEVLKDEL